MKKLPEKIISFCNYRERSSKEVLNKLFSLGYDNENSNKILNQLIKINLVNNLRFAKSFSRGKLIINKWGKLKIRLHLVNKGIEQNDIKDALNSIDKKQYHDTIKNLLNMKRSHLNNNKLKNQKLFNYLSQKGFEKNLILEYINNSII